MELPYDVAPIKSPNNSLFLVFLFTDEENAHYFYRALMKDWETELDVVLEDSGTYSFIFSSNNSPGQFYIKTGRTKENNPNIEMITNPDYKEYCYLSCGYKDEQSGRVFYNQEGVPVFVNRVRD
ncbi:MAG: hypothetical protein DI539_00835 [Flavobacterium psychrophilum]|nr:MAG: hypothetical protein DI539_00835 [Flavobacterium psychrophilum]